MKIYKFLYKLNDGKIVEFDISRKACHPFGFYHGDIIETPWGDKAIVIGVYQENLWYHKNGLTGAQYSNSYKSTDFKNAGYKLIGRATAIKEEKDEKNNFNS